MDKNYQLTPFALNAINTPENRKRLMEVMSVTEFTIARHIQVNNDNLTKWSVLLVIMDITKAPLKKIIMAEEIDVIRARRYRARGQNPPKSVKPQLNNPMGRKKKKA